MTSRKISFEKLNNTRDLIAMQTKDGRRVKPGRLIRSGHLYAASEADLEQLSSKVGLVVDFRTEGERREKPDPVLTGAESIHLPILQDLTAGITREKESTDMMIKEMSRDPDAARAYMINMYTNFVTGEFAVAQYGRFLKLLCEDRSGAVLWHCTAGKDRAGFAAALVQEILGVPRDSIMQDYLMTNEYLKEEVDGLIAMVQRQTAQESPRTEEALRLLFGAREEYLMALYGEIDELYGDFQTFLQRGLGLDAKMQEQMRSLYVE